MNFSGIKKDFSEGTRARTEEQSIPHPSMGYALRCMALFELFNWYLPVPSGEILRRLENHFREDEKGLQQLKALMYFHCTQHQSIGSLGSSSIKIC